MAGETVFFVMTEFGGIGVTVYLALPAGEYEKETKGLRVKIP